jgi:hypothetical protein
MHGGGEIRLVRTSVHSHARASAHTGRAVEWLKRKHPASSQRRRESRRLGHGVPPGAASQHERLHSSGVLSGQARGQARPVNNATVGLDRIPSPVPRNVSWGGLRTPGNAEPANLRAQTVTIEASTRRADSALCPELRSFPPLKCSLSVTAQAWTRPAADVARMRPLPACSLQSRLPARDPTKDEGGARTAGVNGPAELAAITCSAADRPRELSGLNRREP